MESNISQSILTLDEQRQIFYASLLRFSEEANILRDVALDRVILCGLLNSSKDNPYRIGQIQKNLGKGLEGPEIRVEIIQKTLNRLIQLRKVRQIEFNKHHTYFLTDEAVKELNETIGEADLLFSRTLQKLLKDTGHLLNYEKGASICRKFICECFARFGKDIAKTFTGRLNHEDLVDSKDAEVAFYAAVDKEHLHPEVIDLLKAKCISFLKSREPNDEKLKFKLTQGYYIAQLLGLDDGYFDPLAKQSFNGAVFFIDTNVLIPRLVSQHEQGVMFDEMIRVAKRLGITVCVTRSTINEAKKAAHSRIVQIKKILTKASEQIKQLTINDKFLLAFLTQRERDPRITPEKLFEPFNDIESILTKEIGIAIVEQVESEIHLHPYYDTAADVINREAESIGGWAKSAPVLNHDVFHFALVENERKKNPKTWFVTNDRSLVQAGIELADQQQPFCIMLTFFLQSLSPFVTASEATSFVDIFSTFVSEQIILANHSLDMKDIELLVEIHEDVQSMPTNQVVEVYDYIKRNAFPRYPASDRDNLSLLRLEFRKFMTASVDKQRQVLHEEVERFKREKENERKLAQEERKRREEADKKAEDLRVELSVLQEQILNLQSIYESKEDEIQAINKGGEREKKIRLANMTLFGFIFDLCLSLFRQDITQAIVNKHKSLIGKELYVDKFVGTTGFTALLVPSLMFLHSNKIKGEYKGALICFVFTIGMIVSQILDESTASGISAYIDIGTLIALIYLLFSSYKQEK
jgi:hypothetical protein